MNQWYVSKDFWAGLMFMALGIFAILMARDYPFGSTLSMGPGYFPSVVGGVLICLGFVILLKGLRHIDRIEWTWSVRALIILPVALIAFGFLIGRVGLVPSLAVVAIGSAAAIPKFRISEILLLTAGLIFFMIAVFVWGLDLPYRLFSFS